MIHNNKGITLLELAIGILIAGVILSAAFSLYITQHKQFIIQGEISDVQSNIRSATAELASKIRMAGSQLPFGMQIIQASDTNPDSITLAYASPELRDVKIEHDMPDSTAQLLCDGHDLTNLNENEWAYIVDPILGEGEYFLVSGVDYSLSIIQHSDMALSHSYPAGSKVLKIVQYKYFVDASDSLHPNLMRQQNDNAPQIFAENIIDLQFRYLLSSTNIVDVPIYDRMIREVIISVNARTDQQDQDFQNQYRYRALTTAVKVRNIGLN
jgi:hypothetical protein